MATQALGKPAKVAVLRRFVQDSRAIILLVFLGKNTLCCDNKKYDDKHHAKQAWQKTQHADQARLAQLIVTKGE
jgi:hypothetical protein